MTQWFRRGGDSARRATAPLPPTPGGSGGSGFGSVGGAPPGPEGPTSAGERRDAAAARRSRGDAGHGDGARPARGGPTSRVAARLPGTGGTTPATPEERRFSQVYAEDRVGPMPYANQATPDVGAARSRVRALVDDLLPGGVDEGTGGALDPLIASWASGWLARIDSQHADHHAVVDRLVGGARQQLAEAEATHERDRRALEIARTDYSDARERLIQPVGEPDATGDGAEPGRRATPGGGRSGDRGRLRDRLRRVGPGRGQGESGRDRGESGRDQDRVPPSEPATSPFRTPPASYRPPLGRHVADPASGDGRAEPTPEDPPREPS